MDWLSTWPGTASVFIASIALVIVVGLVARATRGWKRLGIGKLVMEKDGKGNDVARIAESSMLSSGEFQRAVSEAVRIVREEGGHVCHQEPFLRAAATGLPETMRATAALVREAIDDRKKNGVLKASLPGIEAGVAAFDRLGKEGMVAG